jgi:preprotein translocase subunit YajC
MTFKKGDQVRTDDGSIGEILFIDRDGVEAQVALAQVSMKLRTESLEKVAAEGAVGKPKVAKKKPTRSK